MLDAKSGAGSLAGPSVNGEKKNTINGARNHFDNAVDFNVAAIIEI